MPYFLAGVAALFLLLSGLNAATKVNPALAARFVKRAGGTASILAALALLAWGRIGVALGVGGFGLWLLGFGKAPKWWPFAGRDGARQPGTTSHVTSPAIEMELDHESGAMRGRVLAGEFAGSSLDDLGPEQCRTLHLWCSVHDGEGARLLEAYLDRRFAGWRAAEQSDADARRSVRAGAMTENQAREILGVAENADGEAVAQAHRRLMKKMHPDHGGTTESAARLNEARDVLMRRHI